MIKKINKKNFSRYGRVIDYPDKKLKSKSKNLFRIVLKEKSKIGWRIAYLVVRDKTVARLEKHPDSFESFEPVTGRSLLYLANDNQPEKIECFYLDKPVILKKSIWHAIVTKGAESEVKITENAEVKCVYYDLAAGRLKNNG